MRLLQLKYRITVLLLLAFQWSWCQESVKVRFLPHWLYQAQFAGYVMAQEKGYFKEYGLDVTFVPGGPARPVMTSLAQGDADIAVGFLSSGIKARAQGLDVVLIGQVSQRTALLFVARKGSGIQSPGDLNGRKVGIWYSDFQELPLSFLSRHQVKCEIVPVHSTINMFLWQAIDAMSIMWYNEYHQLIQAGLDEDELVVFDFQEYDLNYPEDGLYCNGDWLKANPDAARAFVQASMKGWEYAFAHADETINVVLKYMRINHMPANRPHQVWMLQRMQDVIRPEGKKMTAALKLEDYLRTAEALRSAGSIQAVPKFQDFYRGP